MMRITDILDKVSEYTPDADLDIIDRAYIYSAKVHAGQMRLSGEPYLTHPLEVAAILADMQFDVESIAAALLHDVVEDTHATKQDIEDMFGHNVAHIVSGVTKLSKLTSLTKESQQAESLRKMILAMADDIRVILIKLADRLHNMRTLKYHKRVEKQKSIAQETLDIYVPIAARLGIFWMKQELEDIAFFYTMPEEYEKINALLSRDRGEKGKYIETVKKQLKDKIDSAGFLSDIKGRYKHPYSIYHKMLSQNLEFNEIYDIIAFRIIVETVADCYNSLGIIHSMWKPIHNKIKDYIGVPKPNGYQSLHTTVIGPYGKRVEIQIRTNEMDQVAESGIAAHWSYKEGAELDDKTVGTFTWLRNLVENQRESNDPGELIENVKIDLYPDEIYIFTPGGDIKTLPKGATPVDFAYMIHTEVGAHCTGAKVNNKIVPLAHKLETGDTVQIITSKEHYPSADWLSFVKTVKARTKIRQWVKTKEKERGISLGKEMCEKIFRKNNKNFTGLIKSGEIEKAAAAFGFKTCDDLIAQVGFGKLTPLQILHKAIPDTERQKEKKPSIFSKIIGSTKGKGKSTGIIVKGMDDILVKFAKCCNPLPGDSIKGYITQGQGVAIHRKNCINILKKSPERLIDVQWSEELTEAYPAVIRVRSDDRVGLLADVTSTITKNKANIINGHTETDEYGIVNSYFTISVESIEQLSKIIAEIKKIKKVRDAKRILSINS